MVELPRKRQYNGKEVGYLSNSQVNTLLTCNRRYEFKYILGEPDTESIDLVYGKSVHSALEKANKKRKEGQTLEPVIVAQDAMEIFQHNMELAKLPFVNDDVDEVGSTTKAMWRELLVKNLYPVEAELELEYPIDDWLAYGVADLLCIDDQFQYHLIDFKTSRKIPPSAINRSHALQILVYVNALRLLNYDVKFGWLAYIIKRDNAQVVWKKVPITENSLKWSIQMMRNAKRIIDTGVFMPNPMSSYLCSPKYCAYWGKCEGALNDFL